MEKSIILERGNTCWWKNNKHRKETTCKLKKIKKIGWKLCWKKKIRQKVEQIDTRIFYEYRFKIE